MPVSQDQIIKDLQEHNQRMQKQINELTERLNQMVDLSTPTDTFEEKVWETALSVAVSSMYNSNQILPNDPAILKKMQTRALHSVDLWVEAAKVYKAEKERARKEAKHDPIKDLLK